jgi:hypothetical protein
MTTRKELLLAVQEQVIENVQNAPVFRNLEGKETALVIDPNTFLYKEVVKEDEIDAIQERGKLLLEGL